MVLAAITHDSKLLTRSTVHLDSLLDRIHGCGVTFRVNDFHYRLMRKIKQVWESKTKKGEYEFTSLRGADRKKLLKNLPPHIPVIIPGDNGLKIMNLWNVSLNNYALIFLHNRNSVTGMK